MSDNNRTLSQLFSFTRIWICLILISIPIQYHLFPSIGRFIHDTLLPLNRLICYNLFGIDIEKTYWISDSAGFYSMAVLLLFFAGLVLIVKPWIKTIFKKIKDLILQNSERLWEINSTTVLNFLLFYFMLRYGFDKIIGNQFYFPAPNIQHTELGNLSKDILYWSSMGTSTYYNYFMASMEIIAGLLLLFHQTRFLGLLATFGVLLNVFAVNIGFDITVKFLSGSLLFGSIILLCGYSEKLKLLIGVPTKMNNSVKRVKPIPLVVLKIFIVALIFVELLSPAFHKGELLFSSKSYLVEEVSGKSEKFSLSHLKRIHIHPNGYLITEDHFQNFKSFPVLPINGGFKLVNETTNLILNNNKLSWNEGNSSVLLKLKEIELNKKNVANDTHHWFVEDIIE